jgi:MFS family permease
VLAIKRFGANEWQSLLLTAAPTVFYSLSIFWNDLLKRRTIARYLRVYWLLASLPLAAIALADSYWMLLLPFLIVCVGGAGYPPANGEIIQALYRPDRRGAYYGILWGAGAVATAVFGYGMGVWLKHDETAFRVFMPAIAVIQGLGVVLFAWLSRLCGHDARRVLLPDAQRGHLGRVVDPVLNMGSILRADPVFARYEAAYMTYGVGWMIVAALLPLLVTHDLGLNYEEISRSTQVAYLAALVPALWPAGRLLDRLGAVRSTAISFFLLTFYPLALVFVRREGDLVLASVFFGLAHAGASVGWTIGPVALAPTPEKATEYAAIHATMVGIRGKVFQGLGVLLYWLTGGFTLPLLVAAGAYLWSAHQMWSLDRRMKADRETPPAGP